jgi:hypothetical protein
MELKVAAPNVPVLYVRRVSRGDEYVAPVSFGKVLFNGNIFVICIINDK